MEKLLISACLAGENCKYSGGNNFIGEKKLNMLRSRYELIPVCPERDGGLPVPRDPAEIIGQRVINSAGRDVTEEYRRGAELALSAAAGNGCGLALLKANSPSCGSGRIYDGSFSHTLVEGDGVTAGLLKKNGIRVYNENEISIII